MAERCRCNQSFTADAGFHKCGGGPFTFMKRRDATCKTVILDLSGVTIKFICEKPLSASAEQTGIVSSTPQSNLSFKAREIFFGLLQNSRKHVIISPSRTWNRLQR